MKHDAMVRRLSIIGWVAILFGILHAGLALPETISRDIGLVDQNDRPVLHFAVLAFRPKPEMLKRWQPVADYLAQKLPSHHIVLEALSYPELEEAVRTRHADIVLTQPAHYVALSIKQNLYSPLATLVEMENGQGITSFGGVIITNAKNRDIQTLADLKGKRIAASNKESLGGFQAQAFELLAIGIRPDAFQLTETGVQDGVISALNAGQVDAGFVRTGLIEKMTREGKIDLAQFRVIRADATPDYPLLLSTRLYPEWALAAMPWVDPAASRQIASAALTLPEDSEIAKAAQIRGFTIPGDYRSVDRLMRGLRTPPFDEVVSFHTIWEDYRMLVLLASVLIGTSIVWVIILRLRGLKDHRLAEAALRESEQHFRTLANSGQALIWTAGTDKLCNYFNDPWLRFTGRTLEQELGNGWAEGVHPDDLARCLEIYATRFDNREAFSMEYRLRCADGSYRWIIDHGNPRHDSSGNFIGYIGFCYDITDRKQADDQLRQAASVFQSANEGIVITDTNGTIIDVNAAFTGITGYGRDETIGKNSNILNSGRQGPEFYAGMWNSLTKTGQWSGEIWNRRKNGEIYAEILTISTVRDEAGNPLHYIGLFYDITSIKEHQKQLEYVAHYDALTQLPNRVLLADRLQQAIKQATRRQVLVAVAYIDLDGFKAINDTYGHEVGDKLLVQLTARMRESLRDNDTLSRIGGDEFVAVMHDLQSTQNCVPVLDRLIAVTSSTVHIEDLEIRVSSSIGVTYFPQNEECDADQLLRQADQAMYQAKQAGKNRYHIFDAEHDRAIRGRHESIERIRDALFNEEFVLYYQPKTNIRTGQVIGAEALIRWQHPELGLLPPAKFLPVIEDDDLIKLIGDWAIETALFQMEAWREAGLELPVSVNVASRQLQSPEFIGKLKVALHLHPTVAGQLELEVLETSALIDVAQVSEVIKACQDLGIVFAIDDFGTGYSSLAYLKRLPAKILKIDQSFVRDMLDDPDDLAILEGVLGLASSFQREAIAEGIETQDHIDILLRLGCELGQGYAIARPMPADEVLDWVSTANKNAMLLDIPRVSRDDLPILFAMIEHKAWISALGRHLNDQQPRPPAMESHECRFGQWLNRSGIRRYANHPAMLRIQNLHEAIHHQAIELLVFKQQGQADEASRLFSEIKGHRDELLTLMLELIDSPDASAHDRAVQRDAPLAFSVE